MPVLTVLRYIASRLQITMSADKTPTPTVLEEEAINRILKRECCLSLPSLNHGLILRMCDLVGASRYEVLESGQWCPIQCEVKRESGSGKNPGYRFHCM